MSKLLSTLIAATFALGSAYAFADGTVDTKTSTQLFASEWNKRALRETHNPYLTGTPVLRQTADDPVGNMPFGDRVAKMQQESSSDAFSGVQAARVQQSTVAANPPGRESFAQRFAEMQAASSNSGEFTVAPSGATVLAKARRR